MRRTCKVKGMVEVSYENVLREPTMAANRKIEDLINQRNKIDRELRVMQNDCNHIEQTIKQVPLGEGCQTSTRWVCCECAAVIGYPSGDELNKFFKK